ncbi:hypothetical protein A0H81_08504 [Grifola frondosa]|uniref:Uncharacterized protein n=1 Tax=Grifola frondosa TaxID=5627 RepID=A0A1C7M487_GRIFR|nr:hypothetical protein A0H81_08504 [Grifola frondosa]
MAFHESRGVKCGTDRALVWRSGQKQVGTNPGVPSRHTDILYSGNARQPDSSRQKTGISSQGQMWLGPDGDALLAARSGQLPQMAPRSPFNPNAKSFVPASERASGSVVANEADAQDRMPTYYNWLPFFRRGTVSGDAQSVRSCSSDLVHVAPWPWPEEQLRYLARKFVERAKQVGREELPPLAPFAKSVYDEFVQEGGSKMPSAEKFQWMLEVHIWKDFCEVWRANSAVNANTTVIGTRWNHKDDHNANLDLVAFVGDLFMHDLLSCKFIIMCLRTLVDNLRSDDEVQALQTMLTHVDDRLLQQDDPARYFFAEQLRPALADATLIQNLSDDGRERVLETSAIVNKWVSEYAPPALAVESPARQLPTAV